MHFHQNCFFPFRDGAPSIHSLQANPSKTSVLVTTDRTVQQLRFDPLTTQYTLDDISFLDEQGVAPQLDVIASGVIACPGRERIVVAYAEVSDEENDGDDDVDTDASGPSEQLPNGDCNDKMFLSVVDPLAAPQLGVPNRKELSSASMSTTKKQPPTTQRTRQPPTATPAPRSSSSASTSSSSIRFELVAAPMAIMSVRAKSTATAAESTFHGVILFRTESMVAIGFVDVRGTAPSEQCVRLTNDQFASFFPEFAQFQHPVLTVDVHLAPMEERGWIALGCADGFIRVFSGAINDTILSGPYDFREIHVDGPVMSVSLFTTMRDNRRICNVLAACSIGHAVVYEDLFGQRQGERMSHETLAGSDQYGSIFSSLAVDIDLDGDVELLIGTDNQSLLAYKRRPADPKSPKPSETALSSFHGDDEDGRPQSSTNSQKPPQTTNLWALLPKEQWEMRAFGGIFSLAWLDLNQDGVDELIIASSTGVYIYQADPALVVRRLATMLTVVAGVPTSEP